MDFLCFAFTIIFTFSKPKSIFLVVGQCPDPKLPNKTVIYTQIWPILNSATFAGNKLFVCRSPISGRRGGPHYSQNNSNLIKRIVVYSNIVFFNKLWRCLIQVTHTKRGRKHNIIDYLLRKRRVMFGGNPLYITSSVDPAYCRKECILHIKNILLFVRLLEKRNIFIY